MSNISHYLNEIKPQADWKPTRFVAVILEKHHSGYPDEIAFLPTCSSCGKVISDLPDANIEVMHGKLIPAGDIDGIPISQLPGKVYAFQVPDCTPAFPIGPWKKLDTIVKSDQRYEFEK